MKKYIEEVENSLDEMTKFFIFNREELKTEVESMLKVVSSNIKTISEQDEQLKQKDIESSKKDETIAELRSKYDKDMTELQSKYETNISTAKSEHKRTVDEIKTEYKNSIDSINTKYNNSIERIELINSILSAKPIANKDLLSFKIMLQNDIFKYANLKLSSDEVHPLHELNIVKDRLEEIVNLSDLYNKNVVAVVGASGSGKSSFINNLIESEYEIPTGDTPTTAITTYIISNKRDHINGYSHRGALINMDYTLYGKLSLDYLKSFKFNIEEIMPFMVMRTPLDEKHCKNICFIDTVGYDAQKRRDATIRHQDDINAFIWVMDISSNTTISSVDIRAIKNLNISGRPLYIIANKSDLTDGKSNKNILDRIKATLATEQIKFHGISAYSSMKQKESIYVGKSVLKYLQEQNRPIFAQENLILKIHEICDIYKSAIEADLKKIHTIEKQFGLLELDMREEGFEDENGLVSLRLSILKKLFDDKDLKNYLRTIEQSRGKMISIINKIFGRDINI